MSMAIIPNVKSGLMADDGMFKQIFIINYYSASKFKKYKQYGNSFQELTWTAIKEFGEKNKERSSRNKLIF
jgi:hypothetical protein